MERKLKPAWPLRRARHLVALDAEVTCEAGHVVGSLVSDLSLEGCCVTGTYRIGEWLEVRMPRIGSLRGQVRWSMGKRSGLRFVTVADR